MKRPFHSVAFMMLVIPAIVLNSLRAFADVPLGEYDPRLQEAQRVSREIVQREAVVTKDQKDLLDLLESAVQAYDPKNLDTIDNVVQTLRPVVQQLHSVSKQLLSSESAYFNDLRLLHESLQGAPDAYRAASRAFNEYADKESFSEIKDDYRTVADTWRLTADAMEKRKASVVDEGKEAVAFKSYLEHSSLFLERLDQHLVSIPQVPDPSKRASHNAQLRQYISGFESLRKSLRGFHTKLKSAEPSAGPVRPPSPPAKSPEPADGRRYATSDPFGK